MPEGSTFQLGTSGKYSGCPTFLSVEIARIKVGKDCLQRAQDHSSAPNAAAAEDENDLRLGLWPAANPGVYQSELKTGAAGTAVTLHFSSHARKAGKSCQLDIAIWKWSATPASVS